MMNNLGNVYIEHLNLVVKNMEETITFYQAAFPNWRVRGEETSMFYDKPRHWLHFGDNQFYLAFVEYPEASIFANVVDKLEFNHIGFVVDDLAELSQRLKNQGYSENQGVGSQGIRKNSYFIDPNGYEVEFVEYLTSDFELRRDYSTINSSR